MQSCAKEYRSPIAPGLSFDTYCGKVREGKLQLRRMAKRHRADDDVQAGERCNDRGWRKGIARYVKSWSEDHVQKHAGSEADSA